MLSNKTLHYISWISIALSLIGFLRWGIILGSIGMGLSLIGLLLTEDESLHWIALGIGALAVIVGILSNSH